MNRRIRRSTLCATVSVFVLLFFVLPSAVKAITLSPPILDLNAAPGETITSAVILENEGLETIVLKSEIEAFAPSSRPGEPEFYTSKEGLVSWIRVGEELVSLPKGASKKIMLTISPPEDAKPGSYYAALFWRQGGNDVQDSGAAVSSRVGTLIFLRVEGTVIEKLEIESFYSPKKIFSNPPVVLETKVKNSGDVHLVPKGEIIIRSFSGRQVAVLPWNEAGVRLLPGTERIISSNWNPDSLREFITKGLWLRYTATARYSYGSPVKEISDFAVFWFLPWKKILIILAIAVLVIVFARWAVKKYNKWLIRKHLGR